MNYTLFFATFILPLICFFVSPSAVAESEGTHTSIHHHYQGTRPLGMGDAFVAVANDYNALFYNPAGLARRESGEINLSLMEVAGSKAFSNFAKDAEDTGKIKGTDAEKFAAYNTFLEKYYGENFQLRAKLLESIWVRRGWGIGIIPMDLTIDYKIQNDVTPAIDLRAYADTTIAYGYGDDIKGFDTGGYLSWGTTLKFINRGYANKAVTALDLVADSQAVKKEDLRDGYTIDMDLGLLYTPEFSGEGAWYALKVAKPTFGAVVRNVFDYGFGQSLNLVNKKPVSAPEKLNRVLDLGSKFELPQFWIFNSRMAIDYRDIFHPNYSPRKAFHMGFEFDWTMASWWRGSYRIGVSQGYPTLGISALLGVFALDLATYGEDVGTYSSPKENRVYNLKMSMNF